MEQEAPGRGWHRVASADWVFPINPEWLIVMAGCVCTQVNVGCSGGGGFLLLLPVDVSLGHCTALK